MKTFKTEYVCIKMILSGLYVCSIRNHPPPHLLPSKPQTADLPNSNLPIPSVSVPKSIYPSNRIVNNNRIIITKVDIN